MAEEFDPGALSADRAARYAEVAQEIAAVVAQEADQIARMASVAAMLAASFDHYSWAGFYRVDPERPAELVIGPYQGSLGCLRIAIGAGVCGMSAEARTTVIVPDVRAFAGHIACDPRSRSEIVVPVFDSQGSLVAVFDVDAVEPGAFGEVDQVGLEAIMRATFATPDEGLTRR